MKSSPINPPAALITGASRGIGREVALGLAKMGYRVGLLSRSREKLEALGAEIESDPEYSHKGQTIILEADVADEASIKKAVSTFVEDAGRIDVLVNNAGIARYGTSEAVPHEFDEVLRVNVLGVHHCVHHVIPYMRSQGSGYIFNVASRAAKIARPANGAYAASKFALLGYSHALYKELANTGIRVTALCPGVVDTDMTAHFDEPPKSELKIHPEELFKAIRYLLSLREGTSIPELTIECEYFINRPGWS